MPDKKKIVVNGNLSIQDVVEVVKHELDHVMGLKESYDEAQYEYQIFVNNEVLDDYFEDEDSAYAKAEELKQSKYYNGEEIYKIELWRAPLGELDGELYDMILDESYEIEKKFYPSKEVLDSIIDQVTTQGGSKEEAEIIAYALAQSSYEYGNGKEYTFDLYENDITDTDDFLLNIDYYLRHDRDALELFKEYYSDALNLVENLNKKASQLK